MLEKESGAGVSKMGIKRRRLTLPVLACAVLSAGILCAYDFDATGEYVLDASGEKHYLMFMKGTTSSVRNPPVFRHDRASLSEATDGAWQDGSIWTFEKDQSYYHAINFNTIATYKTYGFLFETASFNNKYIYVGNVTNRIGAFGIKSEVGGFRFMFHKASGQKTHIELAESQTWSGPDSESLTADAFVVSGNYPYGEGYDNNIHAADDVVWTLSGNLLVNMLTYGNMLTNADVVIKHPAVMAIAKHKSYGSGRLNARSLTLDGGAGVHFGMDTSLHVTAAAPSHNTYGDLGSIPVISPLQVAQTIILTNGATLKAMEETVVTGGVEIVSAAGAANFFSGEFAMADGDTVIRVCEDGTLDLTAARFRDEIARFSLAGSGTVILDCSNDGSDGCLCIPAESLGEFSGNIVVKGGVLALDNAASIPAGKVTTIGDAMLYLFDSEGFDADLHMAGTKSCSVPSFFVRDEALTGEISVAPGKALYILGNGLGADASLSLGNGARLVFLRSATVAAPITSSGDVYFKTSCSSVTGTVAGVWIADKPAESTSVFHAYMTAPGPIILSGGGSIGSNDGKNSKIDVLHICSGNVLVTGSYDAYCDIFLEGGHLTFRDGGEWLMKKSWMDLRMDKNTNGPVCLEIGRGGVVSNVAANISLHLGGTGHESRMLLTGGLYFHRQDGLNFKDNGILEIDSGVFRTGRRATCSGTDVGTRVILRNGMYYLAGGSTYGPCLFDGEGVVSVNISGKATLRTSGPVTIPDTTNDVPNCSWTCEDRAQLQMVGSSIPTTNVLHNFSADGLVFNLNQSELSPNSSSYVIIEPVGDTASVGFVLPGKNHAKVAVTNEGVALNASYVVPRGESFDLRETYDSMYAGFASATVSNLTFESGSTLVFPFFGENALPYAITGTLTLPDAMAGAIAVSGEKTSAGPATVVSANGGVTAPNSGCTWNVSGASTNRSTFGIGEEGLTFAYKTLPFAVILR